MALAVGLAAAVVSRHAVANVVGCHNMPHVMSWHVVACRATASGIPRQPAACRHAVHVAVVPTACHEKLMKFTKLYLVLLIFASVELI